MWDPKLKCHKWNGSEKPRKTFRTSFVCLTEHIKYRHEPARYHCPEQGCKTTLNIISWLTQHKYFVHKKLRPWKCTKRPRQFSRERFLKQQMDLYMGIWRWKCEVKRCGTTYALKCKLRKHHKRFHEKESEPWKNPFQMGPTKSTGELNDQKGNK